MLVVDKCCSYVCCDEFPVPHMITKVDKYKNSDMKNFICNQYEERLAILNTENITICGRITKLEAIKYALFAFYFHICRKFEF